jgi:DNA repair photolyase
MPVRIAESVTASPRMARHAISKSHLWKKRLGDWVVNPYIGCQHGCFHCYCPAMPGVKFLNGGRPQEDWGHYLIVKPGIVEATRRDLLRLTPTQAVRTQWGRGIILVSFLTDPYQAAERSYGITREIVRLLLEAGHFVRIQTRSDLVVRDFDILSAHASRVLLGTSLPYLDDNLAKRLEPGAPAPSKRVAMLQRAAERGIPIYAAVAPFMPWHTTQVLEEIAGAVLPLNPVEVFCEVLNPRGRNLGMMQGALGPDAGWLAGYKERWPMFTASVLADFARIFGPVSSLWPDPKAIAKLPDDIASPLHAWVPSPG